MTGAGEDAGAPRHPEVTFTQRPDRRYCISLELHVDFQQLQLANRGQLGLLKLFQSLDVALHGPPDSQQQDQAIA